MNKREVWVVEYWQRSWITQAAFHLRASAWDYQRGFRLSNPGTKTRVVKYTPEEDPNA